jgi:hypothetical protein
VHTSVILSYMSVRAMRKSSQFMSGPGDNCVISPTWRPFSSPAATPSWSPGLPGPM